MFSGRVVMTKNNNKLEIQLKLMEKCIFENIAKYKFFMFDFN